MKAVQRQFRRQPGLKLPAVLCIYARYKQFTQIVCLCEGRRSGRPPVSGVAVDRVRQKLARSPGKSTWRSSWDLAIPRPTAWKVVRKHLRMKYHRLRFKHLKQDFSIMRRYKIFLLMNSCTVFFAAMELRFDDQGLSIFAACRHGAYQTVTKG